MRVVFALACMSAQAATPDPAASYPTRPIRIIVAYTPAGTTDILARALGQKMTETWGQSVIVENRPALSWFGLLAPATTPRPIVERLAAETQRILILAEVRDRLVGLGAQPVGGTPKEYAAFIQSEIAKWAKVIRDAGVKAE